MTIIMTKIEQLLEKYCPDGVPACRQTGSLNGILEKVFDPNLMPIAHKDTFYTYILECSNWTLYKGFTEDIQKRFILHIRWKWSEYTKKYKPICLFYYETLNSKEEAIKREKKFKSGYIREIFKKLQKTYYE